MSLRIMTLAFASLAAAATWQAAPVALAQTAAPDELIVRARPLKAGQEVRHETVSYADLNLGRESGVRVLLRRIRVAGKKVCEPEPASGDLTQQSDYKACLHDAVAGAVGDLGNDRVSALYAHEG